MLTRTEQSILMQNRLFAGLSEAELSGLLEKMSAHTSVFAKNSVLWGMGEKVENAGIVLSGRVEAWQYTQDGQENLAVVHEAGGLFGDVLMVRADGRQPGRAARGKGFQNPVLLSGRTALPLRRGRWMGLCEAAVQSAGGNIGKILGDAEPYSPAGDPRREKAAGDLFAARGGKHGGMSAPI